MRIIYINITDRDGELLDRIMLEVEDGHDYVYVRTGGTSISKYGDEFELKIGSE